MRNGEKERKDNEGKLGSNKFSRTIEGACAGTPECIGTGCMVDCWACGAAAAAGAAAAGRAGAGAEEAIGRAGAGAADG